MLTIDLNSDLGEGFGAWSQGNDGAMLDIVTSANVACGFHAGDPAGILRTLRAAAERGVSIGAHVAYPDLVGFGRRDMDIASEDLTADIIYQVGALQALAKAAGTRVSYLKPHGALYNRIAWDEAQAGAVLAALRQLDADLSLVGLAGSPLLEQAQAEGLSCVAEAFADRAYQSNGQLLPRRLAGAVLQDSDQVAQRMLRLIREGLLEAVDGSQLRLHADSLCVHGDSPDAVAMARTLRCRLEGAGVCLRPFVPRH